MAHRPRPTHLGDDPLEIGSGLGNCGATWLESGQPRIKVSEPDESRLGILRQRFGHNARVRIEDVDVFHRQPADHCVMIAMNVLEHIDDDASALASSHGLLRPRGKVIMFVPAFEFAMSDLDRAIGHYRRYTMRTLRAAYTKAGLDIEQLHYVNAPGLLVWFLGMRVSDGRRHGESRREAGAATVRPVRLLGGSGSG